MNDDEKEQEEAEELETELEEKRRGRKIICTCDTDPGYCEKHDNFS